ncbi:MAG: hypothetical protein AB7Q23_04525 [Hyphomonadaceae bacterium]
MRFLTALSAFVALAACATAPASAPSAAATASATTSPSSSSRAAQMLAAAGRADAPTQAEIQRVLGAADISRQDGAGLALTYRLENCALLLLFTADSRNAMRLAEAHPSARRGGAAPSLEQCAAEASARRS